MKSFISLSLLLFLAVAHSRAQEELPTVYEYFTEGGIQSGLIPGSNREFTLNGKPLRIVSGAIHYFRVHPSSWRDSLRKLRATGANAVESYVPWNLHEPSQDVFDFGQGANDFSEFLDVQKFVTMAQEEDLLVLFRPGPYICAEWEYGGFPSWLMRDPDMSVRTAYQPYLDRVKIYYDQLLPLVRDLQFVNGGPIIGIQLENEYGYFDNTDKSYVEFLRNIYMTGGFEQTMLYTSDGPFSGDHGTIDSVLWTANFNNDPMGNLNELVRIQPDKPVMVMEYWSGWFDYWMGNHDTGLSVADFRTNLDIIMGHFNASVNFYMFQGGTNYGFMNGGEMGGSFVAVVTSYDYDAPLSEAGDYTEKYNVVVELIEQYGYPKLRKPVQPLLKAKEAYGTVVPESYLSYEKMIEQVPASATFQYEQTASMENLDMNGGSGQSYGYLIHRYESSSVQNGARYRAGYVHDFATVVVDGKVQPASFNQDGYWIGGTREIELEIDESLDNHKIDVIIENMGRVKIGGESTFKSQQRGLPGGEIALDNVKVEGFQVFALEFKSAWVKELTGYEPVTSMDTLQAPVMVQSTFEIIGEPLDTFLDMSAGWHKGIAFVNGFNLGRYFKVGPQHRLYVPAGILKTGENTVTIFEQLEVGTDIKFRATPDLGGN